MTEAAVGSFPAGSVLIGDDEVTATSGGTYEHVYPATGRPNATVWLAGAAEVDRAVSSASAAQRSWIGMPVDRRRDLLLRLSDLVEQRTEELVNLSIADNGVPLYASAGQPVQLVRWLRYYAGWVDKATGETTPVSMSTDLNLVEREPYGVVGVIIPWNGPLYGVAMAAVPALAAGNAVVLKPPELAPLSALRFGELCREAGLPSGLVNVIPAGPEGGEALVRHPGVGKIHFTGSGATARMIVRVAADNLTPVATELGGKSANIIFADADLDAAAQLAAFTGPIAQSGQSCACGSRVLIESSVYDEVVERMLATVRAAAIGDPLRADTVVGPVINRAAQDRILGVIEQARASGAGELLTGGEQVAARLAPDLADGYFIAPTVFGDVDPASDLAQFETFGPVISAIRFHTEDEAIANATTYGLLSYVNTTDLRRAHRVSRAMESGSVYVNTFSDLVPAAPYGGYKQSGAGRVGGRQGFEEFTQVKSIRISMSTFAR